jgi:hypothetical protein
MNERDVDFLPLSVEYQEKIYAAGRIPAIISVVRSVDPAKRKPLPPV